MTHSTQIFQRICKHSGSLGTLLFRWNPEVQRLEHVAAIEEPTIKMKARICTLLVAIIMLQLAYSKLIIHKVNSTFYDIQNALALIILICTNVYSHSFGTSNDKVLDIISYINAIVMWTEKRNKTLLKETLLDKISMQHAHMLFFSDLSLAVSFLFGLYWNDPCQDFMVGSFVLEECRAWKITSSDGIFGMLAWFSKLPLKLTVFLVNLWVWNTGLNAAVFALGVINILCSITLRENLKRLRVEWSAKTISKFQAAMSFRHIQILIQMLNTLQQGYFMYNLMVPAILIQALSLTCLLKQPVVMEAIVPISVYLITVIDSMYNTMISMGGMAAICNESKRCLASIRKYDRCLKQHIVQTKELKWWRRFCKSCDFLKIRFGTNNFLEALTPLNCIDFGNNLAVQVLLLEASSL
ncbi:unnamed protein product [Orchesella dallaii]|uniref:Gustatory receptor n=1 Tax=Orchesella dallaii TaxID=48710 RepID=A0ABP1S8Z8_9HEXA